MLNLQNNEFKKLFKYMESVVEFEDELHDISKTWDQLILLSQLGSTGIDMSKTKENFNELTLELTSHLGEATLSKVINEMKSKSQVAVDIVIRNLFERTADIGFLATDDDIRKYLLEQHNIKRKLELHKNDEDDTDFRIAKKEYTQKLMAIKERFKEYVAKYSVYYDIVLFNTQGEIVAKLDDNNSVVKTQDEIIELAKSTKEEYIETYRFHDFLPKHDKSLVYTYKVTESNDNDKIIGYLSLCFKFENEMEGIFSRLINHDNKEVILLLDENGLAIASSDIYQIPIGSKHNVELIQPFGIRQFAGRDYIVKSCKTNGYEGFFGLGWIGHIMIPLDSAFQNYSKEIDIDEKVLHSIMQNEELFKKDLLEIPNKAQFIQDELDRAVWNGNINQMESQSKDADFARSILREVRQTGEKTKTTFNTSIEKLNQTIIGSLLENTTFLASLSIDIMDRNLYERANDCRWWALTSKFKDILAKKDEIDEDDKHEISSILKYINELYTVYTNLFVYDINGNILAVSNESEKDIVGTRLAQTWVKQTISLKDSSKYSVSPFEKTSLYDDQSTYIYGAAITDISNQNALGGIGIVFDSKDQFKSMLKDALPQNEGEVKDGFFSIFVDKRSKEIISCSNGIFKIGEQLQIDNSFFQLNNGEQCSKVIELNGKYYIVGASCSIGYREYKSQNDDYKNDVISLVFIEAGETTAKAKEKKINENNYYHYHIAQDDEIEEIASFYIGDKWLGVKQSEIVEAISIDSLETPISMDSNHHFKGTVVYKNYAVSVLDISPFIKKQITEHKNDIVIVKYAGALGEHTIGLVVDKLGEIMKVPVKYIKPLEKHLIGGGMLGESIVQPPENTDSKSLLTLLNIAKIDELNKE